ncbi:oxygenase [Lithospermum erythrorhizon]|uniref:Oxygenase n=1 Tax=Lithospermum erythrorhizon TaxID=34254 RepID=A0AAV3QIP1_LITER
MNVELFIAGTDTPSAIVEWAMAEVLHNPKIMAKAKQEFSANFGKSENIREKDMTQLPYVTAIIKETIRLHGPTSLLLPHYSQTDVELRGYYIPKHTLIYVNAWGISRDKMYWDEPEVFNPERFMNSEFDFQGQSSCFLPFGAGRRICLGYSLGVRMMFLMIATFIHRFDWKLPDGLTPENMNMEEKASATLHKKDPLVSIPLSNN